jgi:hypothetical protein
MEAMEPTDSNGKGFVFVSKWHEAYIFLVDFHGFLNFPRWVGSAKNVFFQPPAFAKTSEWAGGRTQTNTGFATESQATCGAAQRKISDLKLEISKRQSAIVNQS